MSEITNMNCLAPKVEDGLDPGFHICFTPKYTSFQTCCEYIAEKYSLNGSTNPSYDVYLERCVPYLDTFLENRARYVTTNMVSSIVIICLSLFGLLGNSMSFYVLLKHIKETKDMFSKNLSCLVSYDSIYLIFALIYFGFEYCVGDAKPFLVGMLTIAHFGTNWSVVCITIIRFVRVHDNLRMRFHKSNKPNNYLFWFAIIFPIVMGFPYFFTVRFLYIPIATFPTKNNRYRYFLQRK